MPGCLDFIFMGSCGEGDGHDRILGRSRFHN